MLPQISSPYSSRTAREESKPAFAWWPLHEVAPISLATSMGNLEGELAYACSSDFGQAMPPPTLPIDAHASMYHREKWSYLEVARKDARF